MKENISESLTFDDVSMLMNEKGSFTEKITSHSFPNKILNHSKTIAIVEMISKPEKLQHSSSLLRILK